MNGVGSRSYRAIGPGLCEFPRTPYTGSPVSEKTSSRQLPSPSVHPPIRPGPSQAKAARSLENHDNERVADPL